MIDKNLWCKIFDDSNPLTKEYFELCRRSTDEPEYFEQHHILPKSLFPEYRREKWNLVRLLYKDHYRCHELLTGLCLQLTHHQKMVQAWNIICHRGSNREYIDSETYARLKMEHKQSFTGENNFMFGKNGDKHPLFGIPLSKEHKFDIGYAQTGSKNHRYGKPTSDETKSKMAAWHKENQIWLGKNHSTESIAKMRSVKQKYAYQKLSLDGNQLEIYTSKQDLTDAGYCYASVLRICHGLRKSHKGFVWKQILYDN